MRIRITGLPPVSPFEGCSNIYYSDNQDYTVTLTAAPLCISPPNAGIAKATSTNICRGDNVIFSLSGNSYGIGQTYEWQWSADSINWSTHRAASSYPVFSDSLYTSHYYRCIVTCNSLSDTSSVVSIKLKPFIDCYCISTASSVLCSPSSVVISYPASNICAVSRHTPIRKSRLATSR